MKDVKVNRVGHCQAGSSNKVYIASIIKEQSSSGDTVYVVIGKGSGVFKNMRVYRKGSYANLRSAETARDELWYSKTTKSSKAYVDIESAEYVGTLNMNTSWLKKNMEPDLDAVVFEDDTTVQVQEKEVEAKPAKPAKDWEVVCINNLGMEDSFDENVEYIAERHTESDMIYVWDKRNEKKECFTERFKDAQLV